MQAQRNYQNQQGGTSMAGLLGRPRVPPADAFRAFRESEGLPPVRGATPREDDRTPTPEPPDDDQPETPPQTEELQLRVVNLHCTPSCNLQCIVRVDR